jgi:protein-S-isoprenylcysteine O-methyltransferase Ste14
VRVAGVALGVLGLALAGRSTLLLAGRGRPRRGPRPAFVLAGPYLAMRNPQLLGVVLGIAGVAVATGSLPLLAAAAAVWAGAHLWVVRVEEPRLRRRFGKAYAEYVRRIPRWLPRRPRGRRSE